MKYIHDGNRFLIFSAQEGTSHAVMASLVAPTGVMVHAGFLHLDGQVVHTFGRSDSLNLSSCVFELDEELFAARNVERFNHVVVSNSQEWIEALGMVAEKAVWKKSIAEEYDSPMDYLDIENPKVCMKTRQLLAR